MSSFKITKVKWKDGTKLTIRDTTTGNLVARTKTNITKKEAKKMFDERGTLNTKILQYRRLSPETVAISTVHKPKKGEYQAVTEYDIFRQINNRLVKIKPHKKRHEQHYKGFSKLNQSKEKQIEQTKRSAKASVLDDHPQIDYATPLLFIAIRTYYIKYKNR